MFMSMSMPRLCLVSCVFRVPMSYLDLVVVLKFELISPISDSVTAVRTELF